MKRNTVIEQARSWLGYSEASGKHKQIIDCYNSFSPRPRGYKVSYSDAWCATFVSAVAIKCGATDIIPPECSCFYMLSSFKSCGRFVEDDTYIPAPGDIVFYDWQDTGAGDCTGTPDHVGIVEKVEGTGITVIEGNRNDSVERRIISVNGRYIRGYGIPAYEEEKETTPKYRIEGGTIKEVLEQLIKLL